MKKIISFAVIALLAFSAPSFAQKVEQKTKKAWKGTKRATSKTAHKTAEIASKGKAKTTDKKSDQWIGPEGQTIYIDGNNKYYWINGSGKKIYVSEAALRARNK